jgi:hypothetical protein
VHVSNESTTSLFDNVPETQTSLGCGEMSRGWGLLNVAAQQIKRTETIDGHCQ